MAMTRAPVTSRMSVLRGTGLLKRNARMRSGSVLCPPYAASPEVATSAAAAMRSHFFIGPVFTTVSKRCCAAIAVVSATSARTSEGEGEPSSALASCTAAMNRERNSGSARSTISATASSSIRVRHGRMPNHHSAEPAPPVPAMKNASRPSQGRFERKSVTVSLTSHAQSAVTAIASPVVKATRPWRARSCSMRAPISRADSESARRGFSGGASGVAGGASVMG